MSHGYYEVSPEESTFYTIGVDITHRCNMACANCYSPIRTLPDLDKEKFFDFLGRLKQRTEIRLTGGEPTLRDDLPEIISQIKKHGHRPAIMTNGLRLADFNYASELKAAGLHFFCTSMNGGFDDDLYLKIDTMACAQKKIESLNNIMKLSSFININVIVVKGVNEEVPLDLVRYLADKNHSGVIRIRNIGSLGRYLKQDNYTYKELISFYSNKFNLDEKIVASNNVINGYQEEYNVLFQPIPHKKIYVKITDWNPDAGYPDPNSKRRGRLTKSFTVAPFFEYARLNGY